MMGCNYSVAEDCNVKHPVCDPRSELAMSYMYSIFGISDNAEGILIDRGYDDAYRIRLERREHRLEQLEAWARKLPSGEDRSAYLGAIEFYEDGAKEAYREWHTHKRKNEQEAYEKHERECEKISRESAHAKPLPKPPSSMIAGDIK
jgi:hypothetical protein